jgi:putative aminopeptidase FrvX
MPADTPTIAAAQFKLLERLTNALGVSGDEGEVRRIVREEVSPFADQIKLDAIGNLLVTKHGSGRNRLRVMLDAHMDEIGLMIVSDEGDGLYNFETVGGIDVRQLVGKNVLIGREHIPGVIGAKAIHLTTQEERRKSIPLDTLQIDVGPKGAKIEIGDRATFATRFQRVGASIMAKAIDDRIGVATLIELVKHAPSSIDLLAAFTVQEEVGLRGAKVAAQAFAPDLAIAIDSTPAYDLPRYDGGENTQYNTRLDHGPAIYIADSSTLGDPRLIRFLSETAEAEGIPYQFRQPGGGGTDAGAIHRTLAGIPSVSVSVPGRYAHTAIGLCRVADWKNTLALLFAALLRVSPGLLAGERR